MLSRNAEWNRIQTAATKNPAEQLLCNFTNGRHRLRYNFASPPRASRLGVQARWCRSDARLLYQYRGTTLASLVTSVERLSIQSTPSEFRKDQRANERTTG